MTYRLDADAHFNIIGFKLGESSNRGYKTKLLYNLCIKYLLVKGGRE